MFYEIHFITTDIVVVQNPLFNSVIFSNIMLRT